MAQPQRKGGQGTVPKDTASLPWSAPPPFNIVGFEVLTVSTTAVGLASLVAQADSVILRVETNPIRWRGDGTAPTAANGMPMLAADAPLFLMNLGNDALSKLKFIRSGAADGTLQVIYVRIQG